MGMIYERYEKKFHECNMCDFDDLLLVPYLIFKNNPDILKRWQQKFRYILVDEAQDTNRIQFELMKQLTGGGANITFIGDDYQSIYRRRGAVMENFLEVKKVWPDIQIFKLQTNYRSRPHIVHAGNFIIKHNKNQYDKTVVPHRSGDEKIMVFTHGDETDEAMTLIDLMKKLKTDKNKSRAEFAILYRTNAQSAVFEQVLLQEAIPYKVYGGFKFFERKEVKDVMSYLKYLLNPRDSVALKRIINTPKRKIGTDSVAKLEEYAQQNKSTFSDVAEQIDMLPVVLGPSTQKAISQFMTSMKFLRQAADGLTPAKLIEQLVRTIKYKDYLIEAE
ncbi:UvrD-helicase domain-containing protein [Patescibacteria group bacterium]|nr:UvrD-helicase domain-containing protein [Patescibacteria group bacterium]